MIKIEKKIVGMNVFQELTEGQPMTEQPKTEIPKLELQEISDTLKRPEQLNGTTYKLKTPLSEHALYVTINDMVLNAGTVHEHRRPFEIFINSKNVESFQWVVALTRVLSSVFRKGGDVTFLTEELLSVFDPKGGYLKRGKYTPSLVAEIGGIIKQHMIAIGMIKPEGLDEHQLALIATKRAEYEARNQQAPQTSSQSAEASQDQFPASATVCPKCQTKAMIKMDGCLTCLNCGDSKCG